MKSVHMCTKSYPLPLANKGNTTTVLFNHLFCYGTAYKKSAVKIAFRRQGFRTTFP